jgi:Ca2+-binding RTX toxin-like protein
LTGFENLTGSNFNDTLSGDGGNNVLSGGAGIDTVSYGNATAGVSVALSTSAAQNSLGAGIDTLTGFENLTGSNFNDTLSGDGGNNVLNGGAGSDTVSYGNATAGVTVALSTSLAQNTLGAGIDTLTGFENLTGSDHDDRLTGGAGANSLNGGLGNDTLVASGGVDTLTGGGGGLFTPIGIFPTVQFIFKSYVDRFVFNSVTDSPNASPDIITDFAPSIGEKVDVSGIDANTLLAGNQAFNWIGNILPTPARLSQGELGYQISGADILLIGNTSSAVGTPDFRVQLQGLGASGGLIATDMIL